MAESLSGTVERITFHNLDNGYCVLIVSARGKSEPVTVVGRLSQVVAGETIEAVGEWVNDRNFGKQFKAAELKTAPPYTTEGIVKYLGSGKIKGIGPKYAREIVRVFGQQTLDIIDKSPSALSQVEGIGPRRIESIRKSWVEQRGIRSIMVFLHSCGIGNARAARIYKTYGDNAIELVQSNPYRLVEDIWGVGFRTADDIARKLGMPPDSPLRAKAAVRHVLQEAASQGDVGLPEPKLLEETVKLTQINPEILRTAVEELRGAEEIVRDSPFPEGVHTRPELIGDAALDDYDSLIYLKSLLLAEKGVTQLIRSLQSGIHPLPEIDVEKAIAWVEGKSSITFAESQREAIRAAVTKKILLLTGGPGTGKTTIVRAILEIFTAKRQRVALCAPTGRAAKRLTESTGKEAKTIHRLLEFDVGIGGFRRSADNLLDLDLLVVDESSMADIALMHNLLRAVPPWACLVLVGDVDQLPSVGPGNVLRDIIDSGVIPVVRLDVIHRQAEASWIVRAAHAVNRGDEPESAPAGEGDFYFIEAKEPQAVVDKITTMIRERIPKKFGLDPINDIQVLAPMNRGEIGVQNLNRRLQEALNPPRIDFNQAERGGVVFRVGDKVIQTRNNYTREVFNGDIGRIAAIDSGEQLTTIMYDGRPVEYEFGDLDEVQLAYACTIHKSQGSEYPAVVIPIHTQHYIMLRRNLLYTGITRGKRLVVLVGTRKAVEIAVRNADTTLRFSLLKWRLRQNDEI